MEGGNWEEGKVWRGGSLGSGMGKDRRDGWTVTKMNGNLQLTGVGGHLQDETETWDKGGAQKLMGVTLAVTHYTGDMEPEEATRH